MALWDAHKKAILRDYNNADALGGTGSGVVIKVAANFMKGEFESDVDYDASGGSAGGGKHVDKVNSRLRQLEAGTKSKGRPARPRRLARCSSSLSNVEVSQKDYMDRIEQLHASLQSHWGRDEKVQSLKIAIKCAKMLGDTSFPVFYPPMFVMLTEILDTFGDLVFERIRKKSEEEQSGGKLPPDFVADDIPDEAKETCRNWFYKVG